MTRRKLGFSASIGSFFLTAVSVADNAAFDAVDASEGVGAAILGGLCSRRKSDDSGAKALSIALRFGDISGELRPFFRSCAKKCACTQA